MLPDPTMAARWAALEHCPPGSLGRGVWQFYKARGFNFPGTPNSVSPRLAQHDFVHVLADYGKFLYSLVDVSELRPLHIAVDAGNGMAGHTTPAVLGLISSATVSPLFFELDGNFPNHEANPLDPANLVDLQAYVLETGADIGLAFDGDADRCFVVDERGQAVSPSAVSPSGTLISVR